MVDEQDARPSGGCCAPQVAAAPAAVPPLPSAGAVETLLGPVPRVSTTLSFADCAGGLRARWNVGRMRYRVEPGLYAVGEPDDTAPVLVTADYKLTFDALRRELGGLDVWILVLDTRGINVWCAAGKGTFGTAEVVGRVQRTGLAQVVSHGTLVLPQLGAPGVAAHEVRRACGFRVVYGPVRAADIPAFLAAGMQATPEMRRVTFGLRERAALVPVELSVAWRPKVLAGAAAVFALSGLGRGGWSLDAAVSRGGLALAVAAAGLLAGALVTPLALPWVPGRTFSLKGALVGVAAGVALAAAAGAGLPSSAAVVLAVTAVSSYAAMNFTGATTFTSPSGVEREMRRALPLQVTAAVLAVLTWAASAVLG